MLTAKLSFFCLEDVPYNEHSPRPAHQQVTQPLGSRRNKLEIAVIEEDFDTAREVLQESFSAISEALANVVVMSWELTATSTPTQ